MPARLFLTATICLLATGAAAQSPQAQPHCVPVGGTVMTNIISPDTDSSLPRTLGTATGDLRGAVAAVLRSITPGDDGTTVFTVQHHWTTEAGDSLQIAEAQAKASEIALNSGLFGIVEYRVDIVNGTGTRTAGG